LTFFVPLIPSFLASTSFLSAITFQLLLESLTGTSRVIAGVFGRRTCLSLRHRFSESLRRDLFPPGMTASPPGQFLRRWSLRLEQPLQGTVVAFSPSSSGSQTRRPRSPTNDFFSMKSCPRLCLFDIRPRFISFSFFHANVCGTKPLLSVWALEQCSATLLSSTVPPPS